MNAHARGPYPATYAGACALIDELRAEVAALRGLGAPNEAQRLASRFGISGQEARILAILMARPGHRISADGLYALLFGARVDPPEPQIVSVVVSRLRRKLAPLGVTIPLNKGAPGCGGFFGLSSVDAARLEEALAA